MLYVGNAKLILVWAHILHNTSIVPFIELMLNAAYSLALNSVVLIYKIYKSDNIKLYDVPIVRH